VQRPSGRTADAPVYEAFTPRTVRAFGLGGVLCAGALGLVAFRQSAPLEALGLLLAIVVAGWWAAAAAVRGRALTAARLFGWTFLTAALVGMVLFGGVQTSAAVAVVSAVALCGVLLGPRALYGAALAGIVVSVLVAWGASHRPAA